MGSVTQPCQEHTTKPVGVHFRSPGHSHANMVFLPIEKIRSKSPRILPKEKGFKVFPKPRALFLEGRHP